MLITPANLQFFFTGLQERFWQAYSVAPPFYDEIATTVPSATEQEVYGWIGKIDKMREWVGARTVRSAAPQTYTLINNPYELTLSIDKFKLQDDAYGIYSPLSMQFGMQAKKWPDYQLRDLLFNTGTQIGVRQLGLDGLTHWNTAHPIDIYDSSKGTYCNDFTGGVSVNSITVGGALTPNAYSTVWEEMASRKAEDGEALGITPNVLMVPPQLAYTGRTILESEYLAPKAAYGLTDNVGAVQNMLQGSAKLLVVPELAAHPTTWYLLDTTKPIKPFIFQQRQAVNFIQRISEQDPSVFDTHTYLFGTDARGAVGWANAFLSSRSAP